MFKPHSLLSGLPRWPWKREMCERKDSQGCQSESVEGGGISQSPDRAPDADLLVWGMAGQGEKGSLPSGRHSRWTESQVRHSSQKGRAGKVPKKQRGGNGMRGGWDRGLRPASELVWGTLSSLLCSLADIQHRGLDLKYPELALHH